MLRVISASSDDVTILVTDNSGKIILAVGKSADEIDRSTAIPNALMEDVNSGREISRGSTIEGVFDTTHYTYAVPVYNGDSAVCGTVFVCSETLMLSALLTDIITRRLNG
jgi:hypothetical protein